MTEPVKIPDPWERQAGEGDEAWVSFQAYRDAPPDERTITRVASKRVSVLSKWLRDHNWEERCRAFDAVHDKWRLEEREALFRKTARERAMDHMVVLADMKDLVTREFQKLNEASKDNDMIGLVKAETLVKIAETLIKYERLVCGQTTENVGTTDLDLSKLSVEELRTMNAIMTKAGMKVE